MSGIVIGNGSNATLALTILTNSNRLVVGGNGIDMKALSGTTAIGVASSDRGISLGASQTWNNDSANLLTVGSVGNFNTLSNSTYTLTLTGSGSGGISILYPIADSTTASTGVTALTVNQSGSGVVTLNGANTYTGATIVSDGTLLLAAGGSITASSGISVSAGATIENANGAAITRALSLSEGAALVTSAASSSFAPTSLTLSGDASDGWTPITLTNSAGGFVKSGALTLTISGLSATTYNLTSGSGFSGAFNSPGSINGFTLTTADSGATFTGTGGGFNYTYTNLDNTLGVTAVPEPATWALLAFSLTTVMVLRRRRQS